MAKKPTDKTHCIRIPIEWRVGNAPTVYANHLAVQADQHETYLCFFDIKPPMLIGTPEEIKAQAQKIKMIQADCTVRIVLSTARLEGFVEALQKHLSKHKGSANDSSKSNGKSHG